MKKTTTKARGRRVAKIRVTTVGKPPLDGAPAVARLLVAFLENSQATPVHGGLCLASAAPPQGRA